MTADPTPSSRLRRPLLITAGIGLLALGVAVNLLVLSPGGAEEAAPGTTATATALPPPAASPTASGSRHKGEEGKMGRPSSKQKSGLYAMKGPLDGRGHFLAAPAGGETYGHQQVADFVHTADDARSTFSIDVDTAAYANVRRYLLESRAKPPAAAVRTEELINYFDYAYPEPASAPFSVTTEVSAAPWNPAHRLVHIGIQGREVQADAVPPRNLVFLVDVSGSMAAPDKLPLLKEGLLALAAQLSAEDRISLVVYAGAAGAVLPPTSATDRDTIARALLDLEAGGSTNGAQGIHVAYALAREGFIDGGINRVIIATDGDFNVGTTNHDDLVDLIEQKRKTGVSLSVLGFGRGNLDDHLMEQLADHGDGNYAYIDGALEARKVLVDEVGAMLQTIAKDVKIQVEFDPARVAQHRLIGYENRVMGHADFDDDTKDAGEVGSGHSVTALYEVVPIGGVETSELGTLRLRHKAPEGGRSEATSVALIDAGLELDDTSDAFRFSAAVAMFGQKLRGSEAQGHTRYADVVALASGALGEDPYCYRHQFLEIATKAGHLEGELIDLEIAACTPASPDGAGPTAGAAFFIELLRVLPPLLALPLFVLAFWRPRRRRD